MEQFYDPKKNSPRQLNMLRKNGESILLKKHGGSEMKNTNNGSKRAKQYAQMVLSPGREKVTAWNEVDFYKDKATPNKRGKGSLSPTERPSQSIRQKPSQSIQPKDLEALELDVEMPPQNYCVPSRWEQSGFRYVVVNP